VPCLLCAQADVAAAAEKGELLGTVSQDVRLDNRVLDLRTPANQAIFRLQHAVTQVRQGRLLQDVVCFNSPAWLCLTLNVLVHPQGGGCCNGAVRHPTMGLCLGSPGWRTSGWVRYACGIGEGEGGA